MKKFKFFLLALMACCTAIIAVHAMKTRMDIYMKTGNVEDHMVSEIDSVKLRPGGIDSMVIYKGDGKYSLTKLSLVDSVKFSEVVVDSGALIKSAFKVSATKSVYFSQGNLQASREKLILEIIDENIRWCYSTKWRFAENQYDYIGSANNNISSTYTGWIDLFGWGTSGWNSGANAYQPWSTSEADTAYYPGGSATNDLTGDYAQADWGVYNAISNGGNEPNKWRTLTISEWQYLFKNNKWTLGYIKTSETDSSLCFFLIPDGFTAPSGVKVTVISTSLSLSDGYSGGISASSYAGNTYTTEQFDTLERLGVVALPCGGYRINKTLNRAEGGFYWSASRDDEDYAYAFNFYATSATSNLSSYRCSGNSVRLIQDANFDIHFVNADGTTLLDTTVARGVTPTYTGATPSETAPADYEYVFMGWDKEISAADKDITYTAVYDTVLAKKDGAIRACAYKVSATKSVYFSQGNLQASREKLILEIIDENIRWCYSTKWRFAENQYDYIGSANNNISSTYTGWIDLFGWGTSGWNSGANAYQPWSTSEADTAYYPGGSATNDLTGDYAQADWGVYNAISNGGKQKGLWRTLTTSEWDYLFQNNNWTLAYVKTTSEDSTLCFMLIPADFTAPDGITVVDGVAMTDLLPGTTSSFVDVCATPYTYTVEQFSQLEKLGVVALPCTGHRKGSAYGDNGYGEYWSSSAYSEERANTFIFSEQLVQSDAHLKRFYGISVRLIQDINFDIHFVNADGTTLLDTTVARGVTPTYTGATPSETAPADYEYVFMGWDKEISAADKDITYTAVYDTVLAKKDGAIRACAYKVSDTKSVYFSQGNLQFNAAQGTHATADGKTAQGTWRFAENQYDYIGSANNNISSTYTGWIDLFGWGTSGWNSGANAYKPWATSVDNEDYYPGGSYSNSLTGTYAKADWGVYNAITNGGNEPNQWRTLTTDEWQYLFKNNKWTLGYIEDGGNSYSCFMLIPETFTAPEGINIDVVGTGNLSETVMRDISESIYSNNTYTVEQFSQIEKLGVVALPCAGYRSGSSVSDVGSYGRYWSSSANDSYYAYSFYFHSTGVVSSRNGYRDRGFSVRIVQDVPK